MPKAGSHKQSKHKNASGTLMVRLDKESKDYLVHAAELRRIGVSDYVRAMTVSHARKEVLATRDRTIILTPEEQLSFWNALNQTPRLTAAQRKLGAMMRGEL